MALMGAMPCQAITQMQVQTAESASVGLATAKEIYLDSQPRLQQLRNGGEDYSIKKCSGKVALLSFRSKKWLRESVNTPGSRWYRIHQGYIHRQS